MLVSHESGKVEPAGPGWWNSRSDSDVLAKAARVEQARLESWQQHMLLQQGAGEDADAVEVGVTTAGTPGAAAGQLLTVQQLAMASGTTLGGERQKVEDLASAAERGDLAAMRALFEQQSDSLSVDDCVMGVTALMVAAWQGHLDVVEWLLQDRDASVLIRDGQGNTALDYALAGRHTKVRE